MAEIIIGEDGAIAAIIRDWLENASELNSELSSIPWIYGQSNFFGKIVDIPRGMFFLGDPNVKIYKYSRNSFPVQSWENPKLGVYRKIRDIRERVQSDPQISELLGGVGLTFDSCLLNYYRNGGDKIDFHSDKEALGYLNAVVAVSLGATREFIFKKKTKPEGERYYERRSIQIHNGDLMLMAGECQEIWTHGIERDPKVQESRTSLTFRKIK